MLYIIISSFIRFLFFVNQPITLIETEPGFTLLSFTDTKINYVDIGD